MESESRPLEQSNYRTRRIDRATICRWNVSPKAAASARFGSRHCHHACPAVDLRERFMPLRHHSSLFRAGIHGLAPTSLMITAPGYPAGCRRAGRIYTRRPVSMSGWYTPRQPVGGVVRKRRLAYVGSAYVGADRDRTVSAKSVCTSRRIRREELRQAFPAGLAALRSIFELERCHKPAGAI